MASLRFSYLIVFLATAAIFAGTPEEEAVVKDATLVMRAMKDELVRNRERLRLTDLADPFFIEYRMSIGLSARVAASLGALESSAESEKNVFDVKVLVGDYAVSNENYVDLKYRPRFNSSLMLMPKEVDYEAIRRCLWLATDDAYKSAAETHKNKIGAMHQQASEEGETRPPDFQKATAVKVFEPGAVAALERTPWERAIREVSAIFRDFPAIQESGASLIFERGNHFLTNSEETEIVQADGLASLEVWAKTQAEDGMELTDNLIYLGREPEGLPPLDQLKTEARALAQRLSDLVGAPSLEGTYSGPVLFEGQAVAELVAQRFFGADGTLLSAKKPVYENPMIARFRSGNSGKTWEDRIGKRVLARHLNLAAKPTLKRYEGHALIGAFEVDAEGIKPPENLALVEKGVLLTLLADRSPTTAIPASNGHERMIAQGLNGTALGPSVILLSSESGKSVEEVRGEFRQRLKEEGLPFGIVVRRVQPGYRPFSLGFASMRLPDDKTENLPAPPQILRVYPDGREELLRSVTLALPSIGALRDIVAASSEQEAFNLAVMPRPDPARFANMGYVPASFIVPRALLFEELELSKEGAAFKARLPAVPSPLQAAR